MEWIKAFPCTYEYKMMIFLYFLRKLFEKIWNSILAMSNFKSIWTKKYYVHNLNE